MKSWVHNRSHNEYETNKLLHRVCGLQYHAVAYRAYCDLPWERTAATWWHMLCVHVDLRTMGMDSSNMMTHVVALEFRISDTNPAKMIPAGSGEKCRKGMSVLYTNLSHTHTRTWL